MFSRTFIEDKFGSKKLFKIFLKSLFMLFLLSFLWNHPNWSAACQNVRRALTGKWSEMYFLPRTGESMVMKILQEVNPE